MSSLLIHFLFDILSLVSKMITGNFNRKVSLVVILKETYIQLRFMQKAMSSYQTKVAGKTGSVCNDKYHGGGWTSSEREKQG